MASHLLSKIPLFAPLPNSELEYLATALSVVELKAGEILYQEGDPGETLHVILSGVLEVLKAPNTASELILNTVGEGEHLGEMSLIQPGGHRSASVRARTDAVLLSMDRAQFNALLARHPDLAGPMVGVLSQRLDNTNAATFRDLTEKNRQLQKAYDELKAAQEQLIEKERMERELQVAADIQMSILPDVLPAPAGYDFGGRILPARQVGGDFYDVFELGDDKVGIMIGDVADKGVPSAIFMARSHALIIAEADMHPTPGDTLRRVNKHITRLQKSSQFVTALYGVLDLKTGHFSYARAGHEPPLLLTSDGKVERLSYQPGMALGLWEDLVLDENGVELPKGASLLMFTDGLTDCRNPSGVPFGLERIKQNLVECSGVTAQHVCDKLFNTLMNYQNGSKQDDDVTLVAIHAR